MLRARWRELETEPRTRLNGHEGETPDTAKPGPDGPPRQFPTLRPCNHHLSEARYNRTDRRGQQNHLALPHHRKTLKGLSRSGSSGIEESSATVSLI